jgi:hypothetical protein
MLDIGSAIAGDPDDVVDQLKIRSPRLERRRTPPPRWRSHCAGSAPGCSSLPDACCSSASGVCAAAFFTLACHAKAEPVGNGLHGELTA